MKTLSTLIAILILFPLVLLNGWALCQLWQWFAVPIFHVAPLRFVEALGLATLANFLVAHPYTKTQKEDVLETLLYAFLRTPVAVSLGWIISRFL